jgi:hypothetical protein
MKPIEIVMVCFGIVVLTAFIIIIVKSVKDIRLEIKNKKLKNATRQNLHRRS